ncbi:hypothetical protein KJ951_02010 [Patescibacteria group bacterium]|nr:hypothetical protein [Patescibacteria group bacterium]MBU1703154.1 hypothetical protein [Patescibacteria group bacterium]MBU1953720.1 hypothetical protein [Patescibacteria group bacterium]
MQTRLFGKGLLSATLFAGFLAIIAFPVLTVAQPGGTPPYGNVDANFHSVTVSEGNLILGGDNAGHYSTIYNPLSWWNGIRTIEYPVYVDDNLEVNGGVLANALSVPKGEFDVIDIANLLASSLIYPHGFDFATTFVNNIDLRGTLVNLSGSVTVDDNLNVTGHVSADGGFGTFFAWPGAYVSVPNGGKGIAFKTCPAGGEVVGCMLNVSEIALPPRLMSAEIPSSDTCQITVWNDTGSTRKVRALAKCYFPGF